MKRPCLMIIVLLAIAIVSGSSTVVHESASGSRMPAQVGGDKNVLADEMRTGERIQEGKQTFKACVTQQEACHKKAAICFKKCTNLQAKDHQKCTAKCNRCVPRHLVPPS